MLNRKKQSKVNSGEELSNINNTNNSKVKSSLQRSTNYNDTTNNKSDIKEKQVTIERTNPREEMYIQDQDDLNISPNKYPQPVPHPQNFSNNHKTIDTNNNTNNTNNIIYHTNIVNKDNQEDDTSNRKSLTNAFNNLAANFKKINGLVNKGNTSISPQIREKIIRSVNKEDLNDSIFKTNKNIDIHNSNFNYNPLPEIEKMTFAKQLNQNSKIRINNYSKIFEDMKAEMNDISKMLMEKKKKKKFRKERERKEKEARRIEKERLTKIAEKNGEQNQYKFNNRENSNDEPEKFKREGNRKSSTGKHENLGNFSNREGNRRTSRSRENKGNFSNRSDNYQLPSTSYYVMPSVQELNNENSRGITGIIRSPDKNKESYNDTFVDKYAKNTVVNVNTIKMIDTDDKRLNTSTLITNTLVKSIANLIKNELKEELINDYKNEGKNEVINANISNGEENKECIINGNGILINNGAVNLNNSSINKSTNKYINTFEHWNFPSEDKSRNNNFSSKEKLERVRAVENFLSNKGLDKQDEPEKHKKEYNENNCIYNNEDELIDKKCSNPSLDNIIDIGGEFMSINDAIKQIYKNNKIPKGIKDEILAQGILINYDKDTELNKDNSKVHDAIKRAYKNLFVPEGYKFIKQNDSKGEIKEKDLDFFNELMHREVEKNNEKEDNINKDNTENIKNNETLKLPTPVSTPKNKIEQDKLLNSNKELQNKNEEFNSGNTFMNDKPTILSDQVIQKLTEKNEDSDNKEINNSVHKENININNIEDNDSKHENDKQNIEEKIIEESNKIKYNRNSKESNYLEKDEFYDYNNNIVVSKRETSESHYFENENEKNNTNVLNDFNNLNDKNKIEEYRNHESLEDEIDNTENNIIPDKTNDKYDERNDEWNFSKPLQIIKESKELISDAKDSDNIESSYTPIEQNKINEIEGGIKENKLDEDKDIKQEPKVKYSSKEIQTSTKSITKVEIPKPNIISENVIDINIQQNIKKSDNIENIDGKNKIIDEPRHSKNSNNSNNSRRINYRNNYQNNNDNEYNYYDNNGYNEDQYYYYNKSSDEDILEAFNKYKNYIQSNMNQHQYFVNGLGGDPDNNQRNNNEKNSNKFHELKTPDEDLDFNINLNYENTNKPHTPRATPTPISPIKSNSQDRETPIPKLGEKPIEYLDLESYRNKNKKNKKKKNNKFELRQTTTKDDDTNQHISRIGNELKKGGLTPDMQLSPERTSPRKFHAPGNSPVRMRGLEALDGNDIKLYVSYYILIKFIFLFMYIYNLLEFGSSKTMQVYHILRGLI